MRAIIQRSFGEPHVLEIEEVQEPEPLPTEVLVSVDAAAINPVDLKTRQGKGMAGILGDPPFIPGWDVSGTVEELGMGVTTLAVGDRVFGMVRFPHAGSAYAEYVTAPSRHFARTPDDLDAVHAAGLPLAGLTAWQILVDTAGVQPGDRVLIHAASGGVGHLAVQIAKARGAHVIGTASGAKHEFLAGIGIDQVIDYKEARFEDEIDEPVDLVVDLVGGDEQGTRSLSVLKEGGLLIAVPGGVSDELLAAAEKQGKRGGGILVEPDHAGLMNLAQLIADGSLRVEIDEVFPLEDAAAAHIHLERGHGPGKTVLRI